MLDFKNVSVSIGKKNILDDISVSFEEGKITVSVFHFIIRHGKIQVALSGKRAIRFFKSERRLSYGNQMRMRQCFSEIRPCHQRL